MKKIIISFFMILILVSTAAFAADAPIIVTPDTLQWHPDPNIEGVQVAVVYGNPQEKGFYIIRVKFPAGFEVPVHTHTFNEMATVMSGTLYLGIGEEKDKNHMQELSVGTFFMIPAELPHYGWTKSETILQLTGMGPRTMIYKKPK